MEFNCPDCGKRLRVADNLINPLVRCRTCGHVFRPQQSTSLASMTPFPSRSGGSEAPPASASAAARNEAGHRTNPSRKPYREPTPRRAVQPRSAATGTVTETTKPKRSSGGGFGIGMVITLLLLMRGGANFLNCNKPRPQPARQVAPLHGQPVQPRVVEPQNVPIEPAPPPLPDHRLLPPDPREFPSEPPAPEEAAPDQAADDLPSLDVLLPKSPRPE